MDLFIKEIMDKSELLKRYGELTFNMKVIQAELQAIEQKLVTITNSEQKKSPNDGQN